MFVRNALQCFSVRCAAVAARAEDPYIDTTMKVRKLMEDGSTHGRTPRELFVDLRTGKAFSYPSGLVEFSPYLPPMPWTSSLLVLRML